jgi:hypothetical protein
MLLEWRDRQRSGGPQSVGELRAGRGMSEAGVRALLERWMAKGRVARLEAAPMCIRCDRPRRCARTTDGCFDVYRWVEELGATACPPTSSV